MTNQTQLSRDYIGPYMYDATPSIHRFFFISSLLFAFTFATTTAAAAIITITTITYHHHHHHQPLSASNHSIPAIVQLG